LIKEIDVKEKDLVGKKVKHPDSGECGIIVHAWFNELITAVDCYIVFFGEEFPVEKPKQKPYVLRYAEAGLEFLD